MSKKAAQSELLDYLLEQFNGPPTDAFQQELDAAAQSLERDRARQEALRKPRPTTRKDELQHWINNSVKRSPDLSAKERYNSAPEWVQGEVKLGRFAKRVSEARKKLPTKR